MSDTRNTPEAPPPAAVPEDLEQRVQSLLEEIDRTAARIEQAVSEDERTADAVAAALGEPAHPAPEEAESPEPEAAELEPAVETEAEPEPEPEAAEGEYRVPSEAVAEAPQDPPVDAPVDAVATPAAEPAEDEISPPPATAVATPAASAETLEDLDADLEEDLERLLAEERLAAPEGQAPDTHLSGVIPFSAPVRAPAPALPKGEAQGDLEAELDELMRDGEIGAPDDGAPPDEPVSALDKEMRALRDEDVDKEVPGAATPAAAGRPQVFSDSTVAGFGLARGAVRELCSAVRRKGPLVAARAEPVAHGMASVVSRPLARRSPGIRKVVGWLAVYTGLLALGVWGYLLFFRATDSGAATIDSPGIVGSADRPPGRPRGAG